MSDKVQIEKWFNNKNSYKNSEIEKILNVYYIHIRLENEADIYITKYGLPFVENLKPDNFITDEEWFNKNSIQLSGTSTTFKINTKKVNGKKIDIVIKYNRMGQDIPAGEECDDLLTAEFNSPFEEFSLVMELRKTRYESPGRIITQKPLAIYVPSKKIDLWQTGRKEYKMQTKIKKHNEVILDMFRPYIVIYEWIKGIDAARAYKKGIMLKDQMKYLTLTAEKEMKKKGFLVRDQKPHHIIIRPTSNGDLMKNRQGKVVYAMVDYELLERTPERDGIVKKMKRINYLKRQKDRFKVKSTLDFPPHLKQVNIFNVEYVYGRTESTNGALWIVGKDPYLFDYFLPERWEKTPRTKLSVSHEIYHTLTKDNINLVWKVSKVGTLPDMDPYKEDEKKILEHGYNSPFEEISIAVDLSRKGIRTIFPRAIYMAGNKTDISHSLLDNRRYESHKSIVTPDDKPILRHDRNYLLIWGYWNGPDEKLAVLDGDYYKGINALNAYRSGLLTLDEYISLIQRKKERLAKSGIEDCNLRGNHLLLSLASNGALVLDNNGLPDVRICNFEFLRIKK